MLAADNLDWRVDKARQENDEQMNWNYANNDEDLLKRLDRMVIASLTLLWCLRNSGLSFLESSVLVSALHLDRIIVKPLLLMRVSS